MRCSRIRGHEGTPRADRGRGGDDMEVRTGPWLPKWFARSGFAKKAWRCDLSEDYAWKRATTNDEQINDRSEQRTSFVFLSLYFAFAKGVTSKSQQSIENAALRQPRGDQQHRQSLQRSPRTLRSQSTCRSSGAAQSGYPRLRSRRARAGLGARAGHCRSTPSPAPRWALSSAAISPGGESRRCLCFSMPLSPSANARPPCADDHATPSARPDRLDRGRIRRAHSCCRTSASNARADRRVEQAIVRETLSRLPWSVLYSVDTESAHVDIESVSADILLYDTAAAEYRERRSPRACSREPPRRSLAATYEDRIAAAHFQRPWRAPHRSTVRLGQR